MPTCTSYGKPENSKSDNGFQEVDDLSEEDESKRFRIYWQNLTHTEIDKLPKVPEKENSDDALLSRETSLVSKF